MRTFTMYISLWPWRCAMNRISISLSHHHMWGQCQTLIFGRNISKVLCVCRAIKAFLSTLNIKYLVEILNYGVNRQIKVYDENDRNGSELVMTYYDSQVAHNDKVMGVKIKDNPDVFPHDIFWRIASDTNSINLSLSLKWTREIWKTCSFHFFFRLSSRWEPSTFFIEQDTTVSSSEVTILKWLIFHWW